MKVAKEIMALKIEIGEGNTTTVDALQKKWEARQGKEVVTGDVNITESNQDAEWDSVDEESDEDEDVEMGDAPTLVRAKPRVEPEVDDDGFTKVTGKKKR